MIAKLPPFVKAHRDINFRPSRPIEHHIRIYLLPLAVILIFSVFAIRLFNLTIVKGSYYRFLAEDNRVRELPVEGKRGIIYDRKGHIVAESVADTSKKTLTYLRDYTYGNALAHVVGYRQIASTKLIAQDACQQPLMTNDKVGIEGVEKLYECHLRPTKGKKLVEVDSQGKSIRTISQVEPIDGLPIKLSIDSLLQQKAYEIIDSNAITTTTDVDISNKKIAIVGLDPNTGEVLLLVSYPSFNPEDFETASSETKNYFSDKKRPLFNRSLLGTYPPGSVFKLVLAAGALEDETVTTKDTIMDNGFIQAGPIKFHNWFYNQYGKTDGEVNLRKAIQRSNDIYFYKIGEKMGPEKIEDWARKFGYGVKTDIAFDEADGTIPTKFWKQETIKERWYLGDTYNLSIGQGYMLTTPIQVAHATMPFANGGKMCKPQILKLNAKENRELLTDGNGQKPACTPIGLSPSTLKAVREGMKEACQSGGTAWPFFNFGIPAEGSKSKDASPSALQKIEVGCKTGTAESHIVNGLPHAWFTVFAPYDNPEIILTVLVEEGGEGSSVAAPIAKEILKAYFQKRD